MINQKPNDRASFVKSTDLQRSRRFGGHLNKNWVHQHLKPRYLLQSVNAKALAGYQIDADAAKINQVEASYGFAKESKSMLLNSHDLQKVVLHSSSGRGFLSPNGGQTASVLHLAFSSIAGQAPTKVYSRSSIAGFKLSKHALLGAKTTLRSVDQYEFFYKFSFLVAAESSNFTVVQPQTFQGPLKKRPTCSRAIHSRLYSSIIPVKNAFIFNELDHLDYDFFSAIVGFEVVFVSF